MKVGLKMINLMESVDLYILMVLIMRGSELTIKQKAMEFMSLSTGSDMKADEPTISKKAMALKYGLIKLNTKVNLLKV